MMAAATEVILHVYDVTNSDDEGTNNTILQINRFFKDGIGLGGIFHSAIQVYGDAEWSFGFCGKGTGVFSYPPKKNPMYTYRESIVLGTISLSKSKVNQILRELSCEWPGHSYDLLKKNCNHFCDEFCERLGVPKLPGWVNRFAYAAEMAGNASDKLRQATAEILSASRVAYQFLAGVTPDESAAARRADSMGKSNGGSSGCCQATWSNNIITPGVKPSNSSKVEILDEKDAQAPSMSKAQYNTGY